MRINKLFSNYGICSRKQTNLLIKEERVLINGKLATEGQWVEEDDDILLDGKKIQKTNKLYLAFNKPRGVICSSAEDLENNIISFLSYNHYIFPIGRLDKESEGLILLTNDGDFANSLINSENYHPKEYIVKVNKDITKNFLNSMANGVKILDTITRPCTLKKISNNTFSIILTQGLNKQIRRMCLNFGYRVLSLQRIRIVNIHLNKLPLGEFRNLTAEEVFTLKEFLLKK